MTMESTKRAVERLITRYEGSGGTPAQVLDLVEGQIRTDIELFKEWGDSTKVALARERLGYLVTLRRGLS